MTNVQIIIVSLIAVFSFILGVIATFFLVKSFMYQIVTQVVQDCMDYRDFLEDNNAKQRAD